MLLKMLLLIRMRKLLPLVKLEENKKVVKIQVVKKRNGSAIYSKSWTRSY